MNMKTLTETSTFRVLSLLLCFCFFIPAMNVSASSLQADKFKVSGIVKDATGEPVIGASVVEKGTTNGTVTDLDGNFNLSVASFYYCHFFYRIFRSGISYFERQYDTECKSEGRYGND